MQEMKKYISLYYFAHCCFLGALFFFVLFLLDHSNFIKLSFLVGFLILYLVLSYLCNKKLQCEDGYSLVQAVYYYQVCKQAGYRGTNKKRDVDVLTRAAERCDFLENANAKGMMQCYETGMQVEKTVTNPLVRFLWSFRKRLLSRGGTKHV